MINNLEIWERMKEKAVTKRIKYLPKEELSIDGIQPKYNWSSFIVPISFVISFVIAANIAPLLTFPIFVLAVFLVYKAGKEMLNSQHLRFEPKRLYIINNNKETMETVSIPLKSPLFLDITVKTKKELLYINFEQYGEKIGAAAIRSEDLPLIIDSLKDFYGLDVYDSRSTLKEEILLLRPKDIDERLMLSFIRVTEDGLRLIINPTSNRHNFIINYQRKVIKTAKNKLVAVADIDKISFWIKGNLITINIVLTDKSIQELIKFRTKGYQQEIINNDIKSLISFLESKPIFQNTVFEISKY